LQHTVREQEKQMDIKVWKTRTGKNVEVALDTLPAQVRETLAYCQSAYTLPSELTVHFFLNVPPSRHGQYGVYNYRNPIIENRRIVGWSKVINIYMGGKDCTPARVAYTTAHELAHAEHDELGLLRSATENDREGYADTAAYQVGQVCAFSVPASRRFMHNWDIPSFG